jgi:hypothetical protein
LPTATRWETTTIPREKTCWEGCRCSEARHETAGSVRRPWVVRRAAASATGS